MRVEPCEHETAPTHQQEATALPNSTNRLSPPAPCKAHGTASVPAAAAIGRWLLMRATMRPPASFERSTPLIQEHACGKFNR